MNKKLVKKIGALCTVFALAAHPVISAAHSSNSPHEHAHDYEPTCLKSHNPQPSSIVIDFGSGATLHADRADEPRHPASLVKMMTALKIFEALEEGKLSLHDTLTAKNNAAVMKTAGNSKSSWLHPGTKITIEQAIKAIVVASANNISVMMAQKLAGSEQSFVDQLNDKAAELGMTKTVFTNVTGLPDRPYYRQITTARDMAVLARHIIKEYPQYYHYFSSPSVTFAGVTRHNHNKLAMNNDHIDGLKTGYICASGYNLAASATKDGRRVIGIVFGGRTPYKRNTRMHGLLEDALTGQRIIITGKNGPPASSPVLKNGG